MASFIRFAAVAALCITTVTAQTPVAAKPQPSTQPIPGGVKVQGCFSSSGNLKNMTDKLPIDPLTNKPKLNTDGVCGDMCRLVQNMKVGASQQGVECWCGDEYPANNTRADDINCNVPCQGFGEYTCGGDNFWTVYNSGKDAFNVKYEPDAAKTSSTTSSGPTASPTSSQGSTVTTSPASDVDTKPAGPPIGGIIAGVVVGVLAIAAVGGGVFFYMRRKRIQEIEEEHRRNMAVNSFVGKPPGSSGSFSDTRVDPGMAQRRMSSGSIDETQDYSRKILRVTNA